MVMTTRVACLTLLLMFAVSSVASSSVSAAETISKRGLRVQGSKFRKLLADNSGSDDTENNEDSDDLSISLGGTAPSPDGSSNDGGSDDKENNEDSDDLSNSSGGTAPSPEGSSNDGGSDDKENNEDSDDLSNSLGGKTPTSDDSSGNSGSDDKENNEDSDDLSNSLGGNKIPNNGGSDDKENNKDLDGLSNASQHVQRQDDLENNEDSDDLSNGRQTTEPIVSEEDDMGMGVWDAVAGSNVESFTAQLNASGVIGAGLELDGTLVVLGIGLSAYVKLNLTYNGGNGEDISDPELRVDVFLSGNVPASGTALNPLEEGAVLRLWLLDAPSSDDEVAGDVILELPTHIVQVAANTGIPFFSVTSGFPLGDDVASKLREDPQALSFQLGYLPAAGAQLTNGGLYTIRGEIHK